MIATCTFNSWQSSKGSSPDTKLSIRPMFSVVKGMSSTYTCLTQIRSNWAFHLPLGSPWGQCGTLNAGKDTGSLGSTWNNNKVIRFCIWRELTVSHPSLSCFTLPLPLRDRGGRCKNLCFTDRGNWCPRQVKGLVQVSTARKGWTWE